MIHDGKDPDIITIRNSSIAMQVAEYHLAMATPLVEDALALVWLVPADPTFGEIEMQYLSCHTLSRYVSTMNHLLDFKEDCASVMGRFIRKLFYTLNHFNYFYFYYYYY